MKQSTHRTRSRSYRRFREFFFGTSQPTRATRRSISNRLETLEGRLMLAGDLGVDPYLGADDGFLAGGGATDVPVVEQAAGADESLAEGEDVAETDLVAFAKALTDAGAKFYGAAWCPACNVQKGLFEDGADFLPFIEVTNPDRTLNQLGIDANITSFPTWEFPDGSREVGALSLNTLSQRSNVPIPTGIDPFVAPIDDQVVLDGSPLHLGLNGYDPNGGPLTFTVVSSDPSLVTPTVLSGNRSAAVNVSGWGDMVFQLFEGRAPGAAGRFIELAESGFYDAANNDPDITIHRAIDNFVLQFGDPTGTGAGGSSLGDFDDDFHPELQHNNAGGISWAKSTDDTNDSQVFVIDVPTRFLDFNHSMFGQLTEGDKIRNAVTATATDGSNRPLVPINIGSVTVFDDIENNVVMLKAAEGASGEADITVTVTDSEGNAYVETFQVTVAPDTFNGGPFLDDIPPIQTAVNTPATFQLTAIDVEGDAVLYDGTKTGTVDYSLAVNSQSGEVVVTPPAGFIGTLDVLVRVRPATTSDTNDLYDSQLVTVIVSPEAPTDVDLLGTSDSGIADDDNVTNEGTLAFRVAGVSNGALVRLHQGTTIVGQATASGPTVVIATTSLESSADGTYELFATQIVDNIESQESPSLAVTLDRTAPPEFTSTPPTSATVGQLLAYNAENDEEGTAGTLYSLTDAPGNAAIDPTLGTLSWTPVSAEIGTNDFSIVISDAAGNVRAQDLSVDVQTNAIVVLSLDITDLDGNPITTVDVGQTFQVRVNVEDLRADPRGVWAAFLDVFYDQQLVAVNGPLTFGASYPNQSLGDTSNPGIVDEVGALAGLNELGGGQFLLVTIPMQATHSGESLFTSDPADNVPANEVLLFGESAPVDVTDVSFGTAQLTVNAAFGANDDLFNVDEDSTGTSLDLLDNDQVFAGSTGDLIITEVGTTSDGGTVEIATDGKSVNYIPAADFFGEETFTYTISDGTGTDSAAVTVQVAPVNDDPTAVEDQFTVPEDSVGFDLFVLDNDLIAPDINETLTVVGFEGLSAGGQLSIPAEGNLLKYSPAPDFFGTETFTYTIDDGNGGTSQNTVTVTITEQNDPPAAQDDQFQIDEDSIDNTLDVLSNDSTQGDVGETLTIIEVSAPRSGGTVSIAADNLSLIYSPAADFFGAELFSYTISDGNGGTAEASIVINVRNINDPPTANDDSLSVIKDTGSQLLDVLGNDSSDPDGPETLTIQSVGTSTAGAALAVSSDNLSIEYTPAAGFTGEDTFTYTIEDPDGATSEATATVTVLEYVPSSLAGHVYVDVNNDGTKGEDEAPLGGVLITLTGTDQFGEPVELQESTDAFGFYQFVDLAPGSYQVVEDQPYFMIDGMTMGGASEGPNVIAIELEQDTHLSDLDFAERGREAAQISLFDFFASTPVDSVLMAANPSGEGQWYAVEGGWSHAMEMTLDLSDEQDSGQLNVVTTEAEEYSTTLDFALRDQVQQLHDDGPMVLLRIVGDPLVLFPGADCPCAEPVIQEDELDSGALPVRANDDGEGEAGLGQSVPDLLAADAILVQADPLSPDAEGEAMMSSLLVASPAVPSPVPSLVPAAEVDVVVAATPADAYQATDLLMTDDGQSHALTEPVDPLSSSLADDDDFILSVDQIMAALLDFGA